MADPSTWSCPTCGESKNTDPETCANCGAERDLPRELPPPRLKFLWLFWFGGSTFAHCMGWWLSINFYPWDSIDYESPGSMRTSSFVYGSMVGGMVGLVQYAILRVRIPGRRWFPWIYLSALGYGIGTVIVDVAWDAAFPEDGSWIPSGVILLGLLIGAVMGAIQFPFLDRLMPDRTWWLWVPVNVLAWGMATPAYGYYFSLYIRNNYGGYDYTYLAEGTSVAFVTAT